MNAPGGLQPSAASRTIEVATVGEAYLRLLADRGIENLFANAGTDFAPLIEAFVKSSVEGVPVPRPVTVPHENVAVCMAMGHWMVSGKAQAVIVHVNVAGRAGDTRDPGEAEHRAHARHPRGFRRAARRGMEELEGNRRQNRIQGELKGQAILIAAPQAGGG